MNLKCRRCGSDLVADVAGGWAGPAMPVLICPRYRWWHPFLHTVISLRQRWP